MVELIGVAVIATRFRLLLRCNFLTDHVCLKEERASRGVVIDFDRAICKSRIWKYRE